MSDLDHRCAPNDGISIKWVEDALDDDERLRRTLELTKFLLEKARKAGGMTEIDGWQLVVAWTGAQVPIHSYRRAQRERRWMRNGRSRGLQWAAVVFDKDPRTIRRWCEDGVFPGAFRTKGGHWRVPIQVVEEVRQKHPKGRGRASRTLWGTRQWKELKRFLDDFDRVGGDILSWIAATQGMAPSEVPPPARIVDHVLRARTLGRTEVARLYTAAIQVQTSDPDGRVRTAKLASALRIHTATLYRRYGAERIREAIRLAEGPRGPLPANATNAEVGASLSEETAMDILEHG